MQRRLLDRGLGAIYVPEARVWHYVPQSRCTPEWTIDRNYRNGIQDGLFARGGNRKPWSLPPWWITSRYIKGMLRAAMWSLSTRPEVRFKAKIRRSYDRGLMHGIRSQSEAMQVPSPGSREFSKAA